MFKIIYWDVKITGNWAYAAAKALAVHASHSQCTGPERRNKGLQNKTCAKSEYDDIITKKDTVGIGSHDYSWFS